VSLKKLGRYELIRVLGKGAMGVVYEGRDPNLDRRVAIKTVKVENLSEEAAAEYEHRFRTEARSAARLQHPNIVSVYDSDRDADIAFLVMEYIQGDDLKHYLDRGVRYSLEQSLKMIRDLLSALDYAHKAGIVHRDIKPANLLIEPGGRVKLTDFGVARIQDSGDATRTQGSMVGTLKYMAPEQVQGQKIDSRADLFSVGVVLYQLLTDKRPFDGDNDFSIIHQIIGHNPPPPSSVNGRLPSALDAVVARALAKNRDERFATARDFAVALQSAIRRAEDQTVVPPADPLKKVEVAATGSRAGRSVPGNATTPGGMTTPSAGTVSSVTQELELVYWKDVKDSTDPEELLGFLEKFPAGIYADLARRRLRKLSGGADQTNLGGTTMPGTAGDPDLEATRMRSDASRPFTVPPRPADASMPGTQPSMPTTPLQPPVAAAPVEASGATQPGEFTKTVAESREAVLAAAAAAGTGAAHAQDTAFATTATLPIPGRVEPAATAAPAPALPPAHAAEHAGAKAHVPVAAQTLGPAPGATHKAERAHAAPAASGKKPPVAVLAAIGILAAAGTALVLTMVKGGGASTAANQPASAVVAAASAPAQPVAVASPPDVAAVASAPVVTAPAVVASQPVIATVPPPLPSATVAAAPPRPGASLPRRPASQVRTATRPPVATPEPSRPVFTAPTPREDTPPPRPAPPPVASVAPNVAAVEQCRDKFFLARELCLAEHCEKPGVRNHPLCVKRREDIRLREEGKIRPGPQQ
jgi:serine/threonine protein kinase